MSVPQEEMLPEVWRENECGPHAAPSKLAGPKESQGGGWPGSADQSLNMTALAY